MSKFPYLPVAKPYECRAYWHIYTFRHWPSLIHPPTLAGVGFYQIASRHLPVVQTINYDAWGWIFKHGVASSLHVEWHARSFKPATQLAIVYLPCRGPFWSLSTSGNFCSLVVFLSHVVSCTIPVTLHWLYTELEVYMGIWTQRAKPEESKFTYTPTYTDNSGKKRSSVYDSTALTEISEESYTI